MKNTIITILVTLTLLFSFVIPVLGSYNTESIKILCEYTLSVNVEGSGSVTKNPNQTTYTYGQVVTLNATPNTGWSFNHWSTVSLEVPILQLSK